MTSEYMFVIEISAVGTDGEVRGKKFTASPNSNGKYVLNKKSNDPSTGESDTNLSKNIVEVETLTEAANLLATDDYLINLTYKNQRALRCFDAVTII